MGLRPEDKRNELNDRKWEVAREMGDAMTSMFIEIFKWQVETRGLTERAALKETKQEARDIVETVFDTIDRSLQEHIVEIRQNRHKRS